jgi:hypothetical protein
MSNETQRDIASPTGVSSEPTRANPVDDESNPAALDSYLHMVDETVERYLTPELVEAKLAQLKRAIPARADWDEDDWNHLIDTLTEYAYQVVRSWVAILAVGNGATDPHGSRRALSRLNERDVDELADDIVTRAVTGFRVEMARIRWWLRDEQPDMKKLFILECALQLPEAYRAWQLGRGRLSWEALEELAMESEAYADENVELLQRLYRYLRHDRDRIAYLLQTIRYDEAEVTEIIQATLAVFDLIANELTAGADLRSQAPPDAREGDSR